MYSLRLFTTFLWLSHSACCLFSQAQTQSGDTIRLSVVDITGSRSKIFTSGHIVTQADSATQDLDIHHDATGFLTDQCALFVKSYGQGGSATVTSRGTEARHTAVLWNGFNINSPSLGVSDLSQVPLAHFKGSSFVHGGSSQVHGNASVGGALVLETPDPVFSGTNSVALHAEAGSFGIMNMLAGLQFTGKNVYSKTTLFRQSSENNFDYTNIAKKDHPEETQQHAAVLTYGLLQDLSFLITGNQVISAAVWYQAADREIPPLMTASIANATQADTVLRCFAGYRLSDRRMVIEVKAAWFDERQEYDDARQSTAYWYHVSTWNGEISARISVSRTLLMHAGVSGLHSAADFREYTKEQERSSLSPFAGIRWEFGKEWRFDAHIRKEFTNLQNGPVSPVAGIYGRPLPGIVHVSASLGRHYALPTMNDLYWVPGGNADLEPEDAHSGELGVVLFSAFRGLPQVSVISYFSCIRNWIRWQPGAGGIYRPDNLREMESYGIESALKYTKKIRLVTCTVHGRYNFSRSMLSKAENDAEEALTGQQLTYTPLHMLSGQFTLAWRRAGITYRHQFTSERFTTGDNKSALDGYQLGFLALDYEFHAVKSICKVYVKINNLYDTRYQAMAYYPAPGRWYSAGVKLEIPIKTFNHKI